MAKLPAGTFNKAKALKALIAQVTQAFKTVSAPFKRGDLFDLHVDLQISATPRKRQK